MGNAIDSILHARSNPDLWEIRITGAVSGDTVMDSPVLTTIKVRIYGVFSVTISERFRQMGISPDATSALAVRERIDMTSQIEYENVKYEVIQELVGDRFNDRKLYTYGLRRMEGIPS